MLFASSPLPPLPINDKQRPATLETDSRASHADSDGLPEDEGFYTKVDGVPPPIPQREVRPRSVGYGTTPPRPTHQRSLSKPLSPKLPVRHSLPTPTDGADQGGLRTSWSEPGPEPAPPLPPRGCSKLISLILSRHSLKKKSLTFCCLSYIIIDKAGLFFKCRKLSG